MKASTKFINDRVNEIGVDEMFCDWITIVGCLKSSLASRNSWT